MLVHEIGIKESVKYLLVLFSTLGHIGSAECLSLSFLSVLAVCSGFNLINHNESLVQE